MRRTAVVGQGRTNVVDGLPFSPRGTSVPTNVRSDEGTPHQEGQDRQDDIKEEARDWWRMSWSHGWLAKLIHLRGNSLTTR